MELYQRLPGLSTNMGMFFWRINTFSEFRPLNIRWIMWDKKIFWLRKNCNVAIRQTICYNILHNYRGRKRFRKEVKLWERKYIRKPCLARWFALAEIHLKRSPLNRKSAWKSARPVIHSLPENRRLLIRKDESRNSTRDMDLAKRLRVKFVSGIFSANIRYTIRLIFHVYRVQERGSLQDPDTAQVDLDLRRCLFSVFHPNLKVGERWANRFNTADKQ